MHIGHVATAEFFIKSVGLDLLYVIPTNISPLKNRDNIYGEDRLNMLKIAFNGMEKAVISDIELRRDGVSYTRDTIAELRAKHPRDRLYYLIGDDWLGDFDKWRDYRYILDNVRLTVANRTGRDLKEDARRIYRLSGRRVLILDNRINVVSSSDFRGTLNEELLPAGVYDYIKEKGLYGV